MQNIWAKHNLKKNHRRKDSTIFHLILVHILSFIQEDRTSPPPQEEEGRGSWNSYRLLHFALDFTDTETWKIQTLLEYFEMNTQRKQCFVFEASKHILTFFFLYNRNMFRKSSVRGKLLKHWCWTYKKNTRCLKSIYV